MKKLLNFLKARRERRLRKWCSKMIIVHTTCRECDDENAHQLYDWVKTGRLKQTDNSQFSNSNKARREYHLRKWCVKVARKRKNAYFLHTEAHAIYTWITQQQHQ